MRLFGAAPVIICCPPRPASSSAPCATRGSEWSEYSLHCMILCHINVLHIFDILYLCYVRLEVYDGPALYWDLPCRRLTPDATAKPMAGSHHCTPLCQVLSLFDTACVKLCGLLPPSLHRTTVATVSSSLHHRKYKVRFDVNMNIKPSIICFGHSGCVHSEGRNLNTIIVEGPIGRHKSRLGSRETRDGPTGTHSRGSLDLMESVPKWSWKRPACAGLMVDGTKACDRQAFTILPYPET